MGGNMIGEAYLVDEKGMEKGEHIWRFSSKHVEDEKGNTLPDVQLEIRGKHMTGQIIDGDRITVKEKYKKNRIFRPKRVFNHRVAVDVGQR
jgi:hypothetical protein